MELTVLNFSWQPCISNDPMICITYYCAALKEEGLTTEDVNVVVGTHGHSDHVGNLNLFPHSLLGLQVCYSTPCT